jgi:hypothetical protein
MTDDRLDLSPLDPTRDSVGFDRVVGRIMDRAALPLARRRARATAIGQITTWWKPMLAVAAAVVLAAVGVLTQVEPAAATAQVQEASLAEAMGIPSTLVGWMSSEETPTAAQVFSAFEEVP